MKKYTDHDIKEAVFYSQAKPELLIGILTDILTNASTDGESSSQLQSKVTALEEKVTPLVEKVGTLEGKVTPMETKVNTLNDTTVPNLSQKVTALEQKVAENHPS